MIFAPGDRYDYVVDMADKREGYKVSRETIIVNIEYNEGLKKQHLYIHDKVKRKRKLLFVIHLSDLEFVRVVHDGPAEAIDSLKKEIIKKIK